MWRRIAEFVGLAQITFLIEAVRLGEKTSGQIGLGSTSPEVFIQLSVDLFDFPEAILATLSHEISHLCGAEIYVALAWDARRDASFGAAKRHIS